MQFFSLLPLPDEKEPAAKVPVRSVLRESVTRGSAPASLDELIENIDIRLTPPRCQMVGQRDAANDLLLIRCGFKLELPEKIIIRWLRFQVDAPPSKEDIEVVSFYPLKVIDEIPPGLWIRVDEHGSIQPARNMIPNEGGVQLEKFILGYQSSPSRSHLGFLSAQWEYQTKNRPYCYGDPFQGKSRNDPGNGHKIMYRAPNLWSRDIRISFRTEGYPLPLNTFESGVNVVKILFAKSIIIILRTSPIIYG